MNGRNFLLRENMHKTKTHCRNFCQKIFHIVCHVYQWIMITIASQVLVFLMAETLLTMCLLLQASSLEQVGSFVYLIQFHTESCEEDGVSSLKFLCTQEELQDLVWKMRDAVRHVERIANIWNLSQRCNGNISRNKCSDTFLQFQVFMFPVLMAQNITDNLYIYISCHLFLSLWRRGSWHFYR